MLELWFKPKSELDVFDYVDQIKGSYCHEVDVIVTYDTHPGLLGVLFDRLKQDFELTGASYRYDNFGNSLMSFRKKKSN